MRYCLSPSHVTIMYEHKIVVIFFFFKKKVRSFRLLSSVYSGVVVQIYFCGTNISCIAVVYYGRQPVQLNKAWHIKTWIFMKCRGTYSSCPMSKLTWQRHNFPSWVSFVQDPTQISTRVSSPISIKICGINLLQAIPKLVKVLIGSYVEMYFRRKIPQN